jgi:hypothetical protein
MIEQSVKFSPMRRGESQWAIEAMLPNGKVEYITGFLDEHSTKVWLESEHCEHWLKARGHRAAGDDRK